VITSPLKSIAPKESKASKACILAQPARPREDHQSQRFHRYLKVLSKAPFTPPKDVTTAPTDTKSPGQLCVAASIAKQNWPTATEHSSRKSAIKTSKSEEAALKETPAVIQDKHFNNIKLSKRYWENIDIIITKI